MHLTGPVKPSTIPSLILLLSFHPMRHNSLSITVITFVVLLLTCNCLQFSCTDSELCGAGIIGITRNICIETVNCETIFFKFLSQGFPVEIL